MNKKKVLLLGTKFHGYIDGMDEAFQELGFTTRKFSYYENFYPFSYLNLAINKVGLGKKRLRRKSLERINKIVKGIYDEFQPDLVFIYNGDVFYEETFNYFRKKSKVALWILDSIFRLPNVLKLLYAIDALFCFENTDLEKLSKDIKAYFLPIGFDDKLFYPQKSPTKTMDILFVGTLYHYPNRIDFLKKIVKRYASHFKIEIYGKYKPFYKMPLKWLFREHRKIFKNRNIPYKKVNNLYNQAKIVLNIHNDQTQYGANPKVFEISGAGAFQIVDKNPFIAQLFPNNEVAMYSNEQELFDLIDRYIEHIDATMALKACEIVTHHHTFKHRMQEVLKILDISYNV